MPDTSIKLFDVVFPDPIIPASRTVGYGYDAVGIPDINKPFYNFLYARFLSRRVSW